MVERVLRQKVLDAAQKMPVVAVTGPRQTGKSTLVKHIFPDHAYANLEDMEQRRFAIDDPKGFLHDLGKAAIIDEVQYAPDLLSYIQVVADRENRSGQYIISGSQNLLLMERVSQSLAGRVAIFHLLPFSIEELETTGYLESDYEQHIIKGFYPRIYDRGLNPNEWLLDYIQTYVERDLRQIIQVTDLGVFRQFLEICAGRIGQLVNFSEIGSQIGVSYQTVKNWLSVLETSFILYRLRPYHKNYSKRIVKTPKLYFHDTGLACALLNLRSVDELNRHFAKGALFENFIINEILKNHTNRNIRPGAFFWNAAGQREIDLILDKGGVLTPIEIKSGRTLQPKFFDNLRYFQDISGASPEHSFLVYGGDTTQTRSTAKVINWRSLGQISELL